MHLADFSKRDDDDPSPADRLNSLEPGARAGVIAGIVIGTILIIVKKNPNRFKNHKDLESVEVGQHEPERNNPEWTNQPEVTQDGFAPHERHAELEAPKDPTEPPPAYHEIK
ncbi:hypothetical protein B0T11DRAFT_329307 [Plectosphaerella cucumerina]|uniref:Uncharacterized protein n=1 Tax=Plectosphaerella cucumerina TaxID=40658 RepID=A0A8K0TEY3_9PEZI|nr:hypothetical protein B0T11DRAFT_329307 [Plectosphaerella cucumerina]